MRFLKLKQFSQIKLTMKVIAYSSELQYIYLNNNGCLVSIQTNESKSFLKNVFSNLPDVPNRTEAEKLLNI